MPEIVFVCPNPACAQPLKMPSEAVGKPLSCPHCKSAIRIVLDDMGNPTDVALAQRQGLKIPRMLLVPGFAMFILGAASLMVNGFIGWRVFNEPGYDLTYAKGRVADIRQLEILGDNTTNEKKKEKQEATPQVQFAALAGSAAAIAVELENDDAIAKTWAPAILKVQIGSLVLALIQTVGGFCTLRGRGYPLAILGCFASVLNLNLGCCFLGAISGLWGILMLVRDDGRLYFGIKPRK